MEHGNPRWEHDEHYSGAGSAAWTVPSLSELVRLATRPDWVAETPRVHLEPGLRQAADTAGLTWLADAVADDGTYLVTLATRRCSKRIIRQKVWQLVGSVAESTSHMLERDVQEGTWFELVTGQPDGEFAAHGHTLRILIIASPVP